MRYAHLVARVPSHRASDSDRELVAEQLRHAAGEGRLTLDELEQRLDAVYAARTYGQLDGLVSDLPVPVKQSRAPRPGVPRWAPAAAAVTLLIAVLSVLGHAARHSATVIGRGRSGPLPGPFAPPRHAFLASGPFANPHPGYMVAASLAGVFAVLVVFAVVIWLLTRAGRTHL